MPVRPLADHSQVTYDLMVVATLDGSGHHWTKLINGGVPEGKLFPLRQLPAAAARRSVVPPARSGPNGGSR